MSTNPHLQFNPQEIKKVDEYRKSNKTAILTILFTDIVGYTEFTEEIGEEKSNQIRNLHDKLFIDIITKNEGGEIIKHIGDSFLAVFAEPSLAVERILEFQTEIKKKKDNFTVGNRSIQVRAGLHLGQVSLENQLQPDIFGLQVNKTSRIMSLASAEQILVSREVRDNAIGWLRDKSVYYKSYGDIKLRSINEPVSIIEIYTDEIKSKGAPTSSPYRRKRKLFYMFLGITLMLFFIGFLNIRSTDPLRTLYKIKRLTTENGLLVTSPSREGYLDSTFAYSNMYSEGIVDSLEWMHEFINKRYKECLGSDFRIYSQKEVINELENDGEIVAGSFWDTVTNSKKLKELGWLYKFTYKFTGVISYWVKMEPWDNTGKYLAILRGWVPNPFSDIIMESKYRSNSIAELAVIMSDFSIYNLEQLNDRVIRGKIADIKDNKININIGYVDNVETGMKFSIYKAFKYINYPLIGNRIDKERTIKLYKEKLKRYSINNKSKETIEWYSDIINKLESGDKKIPYISYTLPGYGIAIDVEKNSTILDFQFVIDNPLQSLMPEPGDEVFLLRYMENPEKLLKYLHDEVLN